jgi:hypothetical protein
MHLLTYVFVGVEVKTVGDLVHIRRDTDRKKPYEHKHPGTEWIIEPLDDFQRRCVYIMGPTGCGKTQWAVHQFVSPLVVRHMDKLSEFDPETHDGIVFDDMSFAHLPRETAIYLADWDEDADIHVRYKCAFIPMRTRKIFTSNKPFHDNFPFDEHGAIRRRFTKIINCHGRLFRERRDQGLEGRAVLQRNETSETESPQHDVRSGDNPMLEGLEAVEGPTLHSHAIRHDDGRIPNEGHDPGDLMEEDDLWADDLISSMCSEFLTPPN